MHEYSLVQALLGQIDEAAAARGAIAVRRVRVRVGQLAGVDPGLLQTAYDVFRARSICADAPLEITEVIPRWSCPGGHGDIPADRPLTCPSCGTAARLTAGDEIILDQLELEVP